MGLIRDLGILLFTAGQKIDEKTEEYRRERENRFEEFAETLRSGAGKAESERLDYTERMREQAQALFSTLGFATRDEVSELKNAINELSTKLDAMNKNSDTSSSDQSGS